MQTIPDPKVIKDQQKKCKLVFWILGVTLVLVAITMFISPEQFDDFHQVFWVTIAIIVGFRLTAYRFPLFADIYFAVMMMGSPISLALQQDNVLFLLSGWLQFLPPTIYIITNRKKLFYVLMFIGVCMVPFFEKVLEAKSDILMTPDGRGLIIWCICQNSIGKFVLLYWFVSLSQKSEKQALEAQKKAEESAQKLEHFIQSFSHELRNPLNSLKGNIEFAITEPNLSHQMSGYLSTARTCTEILLQLINNILDSGKSDIGTLEIEPNPSDLRAVLTKVWGIYKNVISSKNLEGIVSVDQKIPDKICIDSTRIMQVIMNLMSNSVKFTKKGRVDLQIDWIDCAADEEIQEKHFQDIEMVVPRCSYNECDDLESTSEFNIDEITNLRRSIARGIKTDPIISGYSVLTKDSAYFYDINESQRVRSQASNGIIRIIVNDTGMGMTKENLQKLFTKFAQFSTDSSTRQMGTGLGLNIAREIIRKSKGDVRVMSKLNYGSQFVICIPVAAQQVDGRVRRLPTRLQDMKEALKKRKIRFSLADDSVFNVDLIKNFIALINGEVSRVAYDGEKAFKNYIEEPDYAKSEILICDIDMPGMSGIEAAKKIREYERTNGIKSCKIITVSGNWMNDSELQKLLREQIVQKVLRKPLEFNEFLEAVYTQTR